MRRLISLVTILALSITTFAQEISNPFIETPVDSVAQSEKFRAHLDSIAGVLDNEFYINFDDVSDNPMYFRLFMPLVLYGSAVDEAITPQEKRAQTENDEIMPLEPLGGESDMELARMINEALVKIYLEHPELVKMTEDELMDVPGIVPITEDMMAGIRLEERSARARQPSKDVAPEIVKRRQSNWKTFGNFQGKYTQSYYSDNWYKGGESNHSILGQINMEADYAKKNTAFDNKLELKLGFYTTEENGDTKFRTNEDLIRFTSKFGQRAWESWYFSSQFQSYTQFMTMYDQKNPTKLKSKFFAPVYGNLSLGMDYKPKLKKKNSSLSVLISPLSYNCRYVSVDSIATNFGIDAGKKFKYTIGSRLDGNLKWNFIEDFTLTSKAQFYTSYESTEVNIENTIDYRFSRFFSLQFFFHWRFDDSVQRKTDKDGNLMGYSQFKEFLTLNFYYNW